MSLKQYHVQAMILCEGNQVATQRHVEAIARIIRLEKLSIILLLIFCLVFLGAVGLALPAGSTERLITGLLFVAAALAHVWAMVRANESLILLRKDPQAWLTDAKYRLATGKDH